MASTSGRIRNAVQLGRALGRLRRARNLTQVELGRLTGLRQATISSVESGAPGTEVATVFAIMAALGVQMTIAERRSNEGAVSGGDVDG